MIYEFSEVKDGKKRFLVCKAQIIDTGKAPTDKGNVSCGGTGGNKLAMSSNGEIITGPTGKPITAGLLMYSPAQTSPLPSYGPIALFIPTFKQTYNGLNGG